MSIYQRGKSKIWWARFTGPNGERIHESSKTADKRAAQEWHDALRAKLWREGKLGERPTKLWNDAVVQWLMETGHKATHEEDIAKLRWVDQFWRGCRLKSPAPMSYPPGQRGFCVFAPPIHGEGVGKP